MLELYFPINRNAAVSTWITVGINGCQSEFSPTSESFTTNYELQWENRREWGGPSSPRPVWWGEYLKQRNPTTLDRWRRRECWDLCSRWSLSRATNTPLVAQGHVRERARTHLASRKNKFFTKAYFWVNWGSNRYLQKTDALREFSVEILTCSIHQMLCFLQSIGICLLYLGGCLRTWCFLIFPNEIRNLYICPGGGWINYKKEKLK